MKKRVFALLHLLALTRLARWLNRKRLVILCYHGVTARPERSSQDPLGLHVRVQRFEAQLEYLKRHYNIISLRDYLEARRAGNTLPEYSAILTFDDGYRNFLTMAAPRLLPRSLPVSVFLTTDEVSKNDGPPPEPDWTPADDENYLSWPEVGLLNQRGVEFGSHTRSHPLLPDLPPEEAERELRESQEVIRKELEIERMPLAYPYGAYSPRLIESARALGYLCGLTTDAGLNEITADLFLLRRTLIGDDDDIPAFAARVSGLTAWLSEITPAKRAS